MSLVLAAVVAGVSGAQSPIRIAPWKTPPPVLGSDRAPVLAVGASGEDVVVREGGFSDLVRDSTDPSGSTFWSVSDRGLNLAYPGGKVFPAPGYHQKIVRWKLEGDSLRALEIDSIRDPRGVLTTGLPSPLAPTGERSWEWGGKGAAGTFRPLRQDSAGFDFEGLVPDGAGGFFLSEEYGPRMVHARRSSPWDGTWTMDRVFAPGVELPAVLARRRPNHGIEGFARTPSGTLVGFEEGPLNNASDPSRRGDESERSWVHRIVLFRPAAPGGRDSVAELAYLADDVGGHRKPGKAKVCAIAALDEHRLVVAEHGKVKKRGERVDLWLVDLAGSTDVHAAVDPDSTGRRFEGRTLEELGEDPALLAAAIRPVRKTLLAADLQLPSPKVEGIAVVDDSTVAVVNDNDFGAASIDDDGVPHVTAETVPTAIVYLRVRIPRR